MAQKRQRNRRPRPSSNNSSGVGGGGGADVEQSNAAATATVSSRGSPKRRQNNSTNGTTSQSQQQQSVPFSYDQLNISQNRNRQGRSRPWLPLIDCLGNFIAIGILVLIGMLIWEVVIPTQKQRIYYGVLSISLIPVVIMAFVAFRPNKSPHQRVTPIVLVMAIVSGLFPAWFNAGIAALSLFGLGWVTRPGMKMKLDNDNDNNKRKQSDDSTDSSDDEKKKLLGNNNSTTTTTTTTTLSPQAKANYAKAAGCAILMTVVMLTENFFIWVVSATYEKGWDPRTAPDPLQDNGQIVLRKLFGWLEFNKRDVISLRRVWNIQYGLVAALGAALGIADFHPTRQLWSFVSRAILTMTSGRLLRTVSFLLTVLPSQNKYCYGQHYPNPPPSNWYDWIMVGMIPNSHGGCNDLIVSGHATVTTTMACVAVSFADDTWFSIAVAWLLAMDYAVEIYEGFHYSVDMWMGAVLCSLLWRVWKPIEDNNTERNAATLGDMMQRLQTDRLTIGDALLYGGPVLLSYLQVTILPLATTNLVILAFAGWAVFGLMTTGYSHTTRHLMFCVLYISLGTCL